MADTYPKNTIDDNGLKKVWDMIMDRLGLKVDKEAGKGLSTNDYTTTEKNKLAGIASGAEVNTVTSVAGKTGAVTLDKSDVGLGNVGNFKAVSTSANQGLTNTEKSNARANIDTPSNGDIQSSKTLKASVVTVTDAAPINAEGITVDIKPQQDLHGYYRPWAGGGWKNRLPMTVEGIKALNTVGTWNGNVYTYNGITYTILTDNGNNIIGIKLTGIATLSNSRLFINIGIVSADIIGNILNGCPSGASLESYYMRIQEVGGSYNTLANDIGNGATIGNTSRENSQCFITVLANVTIPNGGIIFYPMIRLSTETDPTFAPYSNICPIEGWTGAELDRVGKNLLDESIFGDGISSLKYVSIKIGDGSFTMSTTTPLTANNAANMFLLAGQVTSGASTNTNGVSNGVARTVESVDGYITVAYRNNESVNPANYKTQLELGTQPTTYEPYQGEQYTASFGETVHGGKWHVTEGGTDKTYGFAEFDGSDDEGWTDIQTYSDNSHLYAIENWATNNNAKAESGITNQYPRSTSLANNPNSFRIVTGLNVRASFNSVQDWKAYLASKPLQVCYELATPTTISTPKQNVPMLQGINTVYADCGDTQLKYQPDNVVGELKGEIRTVEAELVEAEENLEIVYEDHVANTSMGIIVQDQAVGDLVFSNALDIAKTGYIPIAVTDTSVVLSSVADQGEIATHCLLDVANNRVRFYVHVMDSAASLTIPPNSLTFRVAYKKA